jgi:NAD(P)-dependent dehydrogenase (short-subunit alcohol dehydrogenase family)
MTKHVRDLFDLTGKTAIVTGGSRGIGKEMAEGLAEAGASLMLCARRTEWLDETLEEFRARGFGVEGMLCDVARPNQVEAVVTTTVQKLGGVDVLINNAGVSWGAMPEDMPLDKWQQVLDVNLTGCFLFAQAAGREMLKRQSGSIINIASISGMTSSANGPFYAGYAASKAGLIGLTRELAASWGRKGIRVNAIAPGFPTSGCRDRSV